MSSKKSENKSATTTPVSCSRCASSIDLKHALKCTICKRIFDFDCSGTSEKLYRLMDQNSRQKWQKKWKCKECTTTVKAQSNVTTRKKLLKQKTEASLPSPNIKKKETCSINQKQSEPSPSQKQIPITIETDTFSTPQSEMYCDSHILTERESSDDECFSASEVLSRSADFISNNAAMDRRTEDTIAQLTSDLYATQNELENTILENNKLQRQINKMTNEIQLLKTLCKQTSDNYSFPNTCNKQRKRHSMYIASSDYSSMTTPTRFSYICKDTAPNMNDITTLQDRINGLLSELKRAKEQILALEKQVNNALRLELSEVQAPLHYSPRKKSKNVTQDRQNIQTPKRTIHIYGSQQCVGLASALIHTRQNSDYIRKCGIHEYQVIAETKPYASSKDILGGEKSAQLKPDDKLVLCIGENDYNPKTALLNLKDTIEKYDNISILVLSVIKNHNLNVSYLNKKIKMLCKDYKNCHFVICNEFGEISDICKSINFIIDYIDYNDMYISSGQIKKLIFRNKPNKIIEKKALKYPKGTIPYYFTRECTQSAGSANDDSITNPNITTIEKKGTIPHYFPKITKKNQSFFRS